MVLGEGDFENYMGSNYDDDFSIAKGKNPEIQKPFFKFREITNFLLFLGTVLLLAALEKLLLRNQIGEGMDKVHP